MAATRDCDAIVHFAGHPREQTFEEIVADTLPASYHIFEGARLNGVPAGGLCELDPRRRLLPGGVGARHAGYAAAGHLLRPYQDIHRGPRQLLLGQVRPRRA